MTGSAHCVIPNRPVAVLFYSIIRAAKGGLILSSTNGRRRRRFWEVDSESQRTFCRQPFLVAVADRLKEAKGVHPPVPWAISFRATRQWKQDGQRALLLEAVRKEFDFSTKPDIVVSCPNNTQSVAQWKFFSADWRVKMVHSAKSTGSTACRKWPNQRNCWTIDSIGVLWLVDYNHSIRV